MATPLIRIPQEQGGTMYAFSSAARDLSKAYYNPDINFEYSKFALIDVPVVDTPGAGQNFIQFGNLFEGGANPAASYIPDGDANIDFAETLQNYALNFENFIATDDDFDPILYAADSEKIFFKWLTELGAFGVKSANTQQAFTGYSRAIENEDTTNTGNNYSRVVKYLGNIDVSNDKNYQGNSYNEIFVNVPSSVGYTPDILFKSSAYNTTATSYTPLNEINGRASQIHPDGNLTMDSLADNITGTISLNPTNLSNYGIEWDPNVYAKIVNDAKLNNFLDYSKRGGEFKFNAILVYYDIYSKSDASNRATNLYGILILDNFKDDATSTGMSIPTLTKYRPNEVTGLNGNAFALKLNVKFNSSLDNVGVESNINDFTTFSMDIFLDTATAIENASRLMIDASKRYADIAERVEGIEGILLTSGDATDFKARISALEDSLENAALNYADSTSILDMITSVNARLNQVISGTIPTEIQYNTDVISPGDGMEIDISDPTKIKLTNSDYGYKLNDVFGYNFTLPVPTTGTLVEATNPFNMALTASTGMITRVGPYTNMVRIHNDTGTLSGDLNIYLDDSVSTWKKGQTIKFSFKTKLPMLGTYKINIYAEKQNGWVLKGTLDTSNLLSLTPYVELICIDEINKTFELEIIR
ncbi:hypothetical protein N8Z10_00410 [bacterium]|nr:hypothetical protein [bacterium]